jgi:myosin heavy subunit
METIIKNRKIILTTAFLFVFAAVGTLFFSNVKLKEVISAEKMKAETLLSQKLQLDKSLELSKKDLADLQVQKLSLEQAVAETNRNLAARIAEAGRLTSQIASLKKFKDKAEELEKQKAQLDREIHELNKSLMLAQSENSKLNEKIASSARANSNLSDDNAILKSMISDNYRTEAFRGRNERLTVNARRTNKLQVSFDLPGQMTGKDIYFRVITPEGMEFSSNKDLAATIEIIENNDDLLVSADPAAGAIAGNKRVEMSFKPQKKLTDGVYRFNLYNGDRFLGSTQLRLK